MACPGSNVILQQLDLPESEESDYAKEGTAAHAAAAHCLQNGLETWEIVGQTFEGVVVDADMMYSLDMYLSVLAEVRAEHGKVYKELVEYHISGDFHPLFFGTVDDAIIGEKIIDVTDLKYGAGIAVDVERNPQLMYYAVGILDKFLGPVSVRLRIVQPRAYHADGPVRVWHTTTEELIQWKNDKLIPAMRRAELDTTLTPGDHCRFCPAKLACPVLTSIFGASITADASALVNFSSASLARDYRLMDASKHYWKAVEAEVYRRLSHGQDVTDGTTAGSFKLVPKKANRVLSDEGVAILEGKAVDDDGLPIPVPFDDDELYDRSMKSPAQLDKLGPRGKEFTKRYSYTPQTGLTVAPADDARVGVKILPPSETFAHIAAQAAE